MLFSEHISEYALTTSPQMVLNMLLWKCCFTSTETVGLSGTGAEDVHLDFHTAPRSWWLAECCLTFNEIVGLLGTGAEDVHFDFHTAPELWL